MRYYLEGVGVVYRDKDNTNRQQMWFLEKDVNMAKFLNRILGLPVYAQNALFQYFADTMKSVIDEAKRDGRYDLGILGISLNMYLHIHMSIIPSAVVMTR